MSYTYPEAVAALESIANDYIKALRPSAHTPVYLVCDAYAQTASVTWDLYSIKINMPVRPATSTMTQAEFEDWVSYVLHELGHPTFTDQAVWRDACKRGLARMLNPLEDVRMEKAVIMSGIVPNAERVLSRLISRKVVEARSGNWKPNSRREIGWTICVLGRAANGYDIDVTDLAWINSQIKAGGTVETVLSWALPELAACGSTADCLELAARIQAVIAAPQNNRPGEQGEGKQGEGKQSEQGEQGEQGEQEGQNGPQSESESETGSDSPDQEKRASDPENDAEGPSESNEGDNNAGKGGIGRGDGTFDADETPVSDEKELVERELRPQGEVMKPKDGASTEKLVIDILRDARSMNAQPKTPRDAARIGKNGMRLRDAAALASRQRALLARALRAEETEDREGGRKAGRLDRGALSRAMAGAPNVFAKREISEGFDTDVCILLDASGSMSGENINAALEVGLIIAQAASSVGVSCTTEIFNSTGFMRAGGLASKRVPNAAEFGPLAKEASGGTPLSSHMARMAVQQAKRAGHKRRVLFVVTDGGCDYGPQTVKRMANYLEQAHGTVMAHVSIGTPLSGAFRAEVCVPWGTPLAKVGLEHFVKVLQAL